MAEYAIIKVSTLLDIADAIREMRGSDGKILPENMSPEILAIETGADVSGVTATADDVLSNTYFVDNTGVLKKGNIPILELYRPMMSIDENTGIVTASITQAEGYYYSDYKENTLVLNTQAAETVTPGTDEQTVVPAGTYVTGDVKVKAMPTATQATPVLTIDDVNNCVKATCSQSTGYVSGGTKTGTYRFNKVNGATYYPASSDKNIFSANSLYYFTGAQVLKGDSNLVASNIKYGTSILGVDGSCPTSIDFSNANVGHVWQSEYGGDCLAITVSDYVSVSATKCLYVSITVEINGQYISFIQTSNNAVSYTLDGTDWMSCRLYFESSKLYIPFSWNTRYEPTLVVGFGSFFSV